MNKIKIKIFTTILILASVIIGMLWLKNGTISIFPTYSTQQVQEAMLRNVPIIDIRRVDEWKKYGTIENSHKITFFDAKGNYNEQEWLKKFSKIIKNKSQEFILVCAHANRTKVVGEFLKSIGYTNMHDLEGGINYGWVDKGLRTTPY